MWINASLAAAWLLSVGREMGISIDPMKLQKLLYYAQGYCLGMSGKRLFDDALLAWQHGPVVPSVYYEYQKYGGNVIRRRDTASVPDEYRGLIRGVLRDKGGKTAWELRGDTHREYPYMTTSLNDEITTEKLQEFFSPLFNDYDERDDYPPVFDSDEEALAYAGSTFTDEERAALADVCSFEG